jgi:hypothetical protein
MQPGDSQDEQVKIARSNALATWAGVLIATSGLAISIVTLLNRPKKPEPPNSGSPQVRQSAPSQAGLKVQPDRRAALVGAQEAVVKPKAISSRRTRYSNTRRRTNR